MHPLSAWLVRAPGRSRRRLLLWPRPGSGEAAIPPETGVEAESEGQARRRPPPEAGARGRARRRPPPEAGAWGRARRSFLLCPRLELGGWSWPIVSRCRGGWHGSWSRASGAVFLSYRTVKRRGEVTAVTLAWLTETHVSGYVVRHPSHLMRLRSGRLVRQYGQGCFTTKHARAGPREGWGGACRLNRPSGEAWIHPGPLFQPEAGLG
jgi:hypothetical protein